MSRLIDLTGQRFGMLTVLNKESNKGKGTKWLCRCDCGQTTVVFGDNLKRGNTASCGCYHEQIMQKHGHATGGKESSEYTTWLNMKRRCLDPNSSYYYIYGGRGIGICEAWENSFEKFIKDMGLKPKEDMVIDRINPDGDYEPGNCRWVTVQQNNFNLRPREHTSSKFKGVSWNKALSKWHAYINKNGKRIHLGYFVSEIEAAKAYNEAAKKYFGEYAYLDDV